MAYPASSPSVSQYPRLQLLRTDGDGPDASEPVTVSAPFETRRVVKECGPAAGALHRIVFENDQDGIENTYQTLAEAFDYSTRQMIRLVQKMEQHGFLEVSRAEGKSRPSIIKAVIPGVTSGVTPVSRCDMGVSAVGVTLGVTSPPAPLYSNNDVNDEELTPSIVPPSTKPAEPAKAEPTKRRKPKHPLPEVFGLTDERRNYAKSKGFDDRRIEMQFERFVNHAVATDRRQVDWDRSWQNWVLTDLERNGTTGQPTKPLAYNSAKRFAADKRGHVG